MRRRVTGGRRRFAPVAALALLAGVASLAVAGDEEAAARASGGDTTLDNATSTAFALPAPNLSAAALEQHLAGDQHFDHQFVSAGNPVRAGLGPIFNADSCSACHRQNGRGRPVDAQGRRTEQLFLRVSRGHDAESGAPRPVPGYGLQLQTDALIGVEPEARVEVDYRERRDRYGDGTRYTLVDPVYRVELLQGAVAGLRYSPRVAPIVTGVGLLAAIPPERLRALADPDDADGDGVSGEVQQIVNDETGAHEIGRFGWKAITPSVRQQTADAYRDDMGVTSPARPRESSSGQVQDDGRADEPEIDARTLAETAFYTLTLGVPGRRDVDDPQVRRGERLFRRPVAAGGAGCAACHTPTRRTAGAERVAELIATDFPQQASHPLADQTFHPYTDLLLHDMGPRLADGRTVFRANGREWRTPPLWGIGLTAVANGHTRFLHDGRARSLAEAILWHGGEAEPAREVFRTLDRAGREALLAFLRSL